MVSWFLTLNPITQALIAGTFTWLVTALGSTIVFFTKNINRKLFDSMLGFGAGVMLAASFWSLLEPSIEISGQLGIPIWIPPLVGLFAGTFFLRGLDFVLPHLHIGFKPHEAEGIKTSWHKNTLLVLAVTLHNFPEGLAIGVAFGAAAAGMEGATIASALALAIGIGLQNFPEGMAVSLPLRREGKTRFSSFWYGQLSAIVEPIAALIGAAAVYFARPLLPYAMSFAAGAMIFVVVEQLIPESQKGEHADLATLATIAGFAVMMLLDIML